MGPVKETEKTKIVSLLIFRRGIVYNWYMERGTNRRERIVAQIEPIVLELGFRRMTTDAIAEHLGISKKTLYQEFSSKQELVHAVVHAKLARIASSVGAIEERIRTEMIDPIGSHFAGLSRELYGLGKPFIADLMKYEPELWEEIRQFRQDHVFSRVLRIVETGKEIGLVEGWVDPRLFTELVIAVADTLLIPTKIVDLNLPMADLLGHIGGVLTSGILTEKGRNAGSSLWKTEKGAYDA